MDQFQGTSGQPNQPNGGQSGQPPRYAQYPQYAYERRRTRWWIPLIIVGVIIIGFVGLIAAIIAGLGTAFKSKPVSVEQNTVLMLKSSGAVEERTTIGFLESLTDDNPSLTFLDALTAVKRAKEDENIVGIFIKSGDFKTGFSKANELRAVLEDFKTSGKFIYAFIETGDERDYFLASVADSIFMPTEGLMEMNGFVAKGVFLKGTLDKIGVDFYVQQFEEYKSAGEQLSRANYSEPAKEELRGFLNQRMDVFVKAVSASRSMNEGSLRDALGRGIYTPDSLLALGFIDGIASEGAVKDRMKARVYDGNEAEKIASEKTETKKTEADKSKSEKTEAKKTGAKKASDQSDEKSDKKSEKKLRLVAINRYVESDSFNEAGESDEKIDKDKQIALIAATGTIVSGGNDEENIVANVFIKQLQKARENKKVKAIILRIDSPGGSVIASDAMWEEIIRTRKEKPVYASMSDVAASGGYYMAMACDTIIAHPTTITGSIGVILTIPLASKLVQNLGVSLDTVQTSPSAMPYDPALPFTDANKQKLFVQSEKIYRRFVSRVAESRKMTFEDTRAVAKGRVWTGEAAKARGLVDTLGGLQTALAIAKRRIGIDPNKRVSLKRYPESQEAFERILKRFTNDDDDNDEATTETPSGVFASIRAAFERKAELRALENIPFWNLLAEDVRSQILYLMKLGSISRANSSANPAERALYALPFIPDIR